MSTTAEPISRADYEATARAAGWMPYPDNHVHGSLQAGHYQDPTTARDALHARRAHTVVAEKEAGTWITPPKKTGTGCLYCGVKITRSDGECEDCGSQTYVAKWLS